METPNTVKHNNPRHKGLIPFAKGVSGNPKGRPRKEVCITSWLKEFADKSITAPIDLKNLTYAQAAALSAWKAAAKGDLPEYNFIIERIEGKTTTTVDVTSKGNELKPAQMNVLNLSTLSDEELETLDKIVSKTNPDLITNPGGESPAAPDRLHTVHAPVILEPVTSTEAGAEAGRSGSGQGQESNCDNASPSPEV